jgi:hypothetical protein
MFPLVPVTFAPLFPTIRFVLSLGFQTKAGQGRGIKACTINI